MNEANIFLVIGGVLSVSAALLHIVIIFGGANWYRFFGAGEKMATLSEQGSWYPALVTFVVATVLFIWGLYAFSGSGLILALPFLKYVLVTISAVYLLRGLVLIPGLLFIPDKVDSFAFWSSIVSFVFGLFYAIGTYQEWSKLFNKSVLIITS